MKLSEAIARIDKSEKNSAGADVEEFAQALDIHFCNSPDWQKFEARVKGYWLAVWQCTDTWVGMAAYFMDGELVAISTQTARKSGTEYDFVNNEAAEKVRAFVIELIAEEIPEEKWHVDLDAEIGEAYQVAYSSQIIQDEVLHSGVMRKVVERYTSYQDIDKWSTLDIEDEDGRTINVPLDEIFIPFRLEK